MVIDEATGGRLIEAATGLADWRLTRFSAGKFSDVFAAERDGQSLVLRVAPADDLRQLFYEFRMMRREPAIHRRLLAESAVPVAPILHCDFSRTLIDRDWMVMRRLPGEPFSEARDAMTPDAQALALRQWGRWVARIHQLRSPEGRFGYLGPPGCMEPQATWRDAFVVMYRRLLDDVVATGVYSAEQAAAAGELLDTHIDSFDHDPPPALLHGDLWVTNLLVAPDGQVTGVLDFDRACWGDPEWDLAIAEYCGVTQPPFWEGFGPRPAPTRGAAVRRMFYLLYEHQKYIVISISARRDNPARARAYAEQSLAAMEHFRRTGEPAF